MTYVDVTKEKKIALKRQKEILRLFKVKGIIIDNNMQVLAVEEPFNILSLQECNINIDNVSSNSDDVHVVKLCKHLLDNKLYNANVNDILNNFKTNGGDTYVEGFPISCQIAISHNEDGYTINAECLGQYTIPQKDLRNTLTFIRHCYNAIDNFGAKGGIKTSFVHPKNEQFSKYENVIINSIC